MKAQTAMRRATRESWLTEPENPEPAHPEPTRSVPADPKVQAVLAQAAKVMPTVRKLAPLAAKAQPLIRREAIKQHSLEAKSRAPEPIMSPVLALAAPRERRDRQASSPTRAGPKSDDDGPEPPSARPCACGCGRPRRPELPPPRRYYFFDECRRRHARARRAKSRQLKRTRALAEWPGVDRHRRDPYEWPAAHELDALKKRVNDGCRCNGRHIADDGDCIWCGHRRDGRVQGTGRTFIQARSAETRRPRKAVA